MLFEINPPRTFVEVGGDEDFVRSSGFSHPFAYNMSASEDKDISRPYTLLDNIKMCCLITFLCISCDFSSLGIRFSNLSDRHPLPGANPWGFGYDKSLQVTK